MTVEIEKSKSKYFFGLGVVAFIVLGILSIIGSISFSHRIWENSVMGHFTSIWIYIGDVISIVCFFAVMFILIMVDQQ